MKKAQGLSMELVIIAIILLLVVGVMTYIFIVKGINPFTKNVESCVQKGGKCLDTCKDNKDYPVIAFAGCIPDGKTEADPKYVCCIPFDQK